ncbi:Hypp8658 [Branchiostoma lanceolatum]|uniref:Hypp8658 protein n=1 Tax=Branchiostoma lanceolatum TaxID=7740 RepID=A0A8J9ZA11_BRALA|nr:Hypp8658 [Branchiostoma lanceolatum]
MTKGGAGPASKPWPSNGTSRKDRSRKPGAERVEEENVRTEGHATRMVQVACKRLYAQINANFRRGKKQYTRDDKFVQAKLYDIICDEARKLWSQSAVSMVRLNYKHDILANGPRGPADKGPPRIAIMMTWPWCKLALEVRRVHEKYHYSYQTIRNCFARMSYLVWMGGCHVGLVALFGTKEDMQKADLDLYCTPLGGESVVDISLAQDAMSLFGYGDTKGMNKAQVPWAYQKDLKVNCIMNKFEPTEGFCVRVYRVHPSRSGRFKEKFSDEDRLNKLYAEYAEYEDRQQVLERDDSAFPSGAADDSDKYFSPDDIRKDVDKVDIYLQCGAWDYMRAHEEYKEILKRVEQPAAGDGDLLTSGKRKMPGQDIEFNYLAERLQDRITYTHQEVKPPPPPPETDDLYVAGPSPEAEAPSIEPTASPDEILAAYVANAGKPHLQGSLFDGAPELAEEATEEATGITVQDHDLRRMSSVKARQRWRGLRPSLFDEGPVEDEDEYNGGAATVAVHEWLARRSTAGSLSFKGTTASRGNNRSRRQSYMYKPPKKDVTMGPEPEKYITPEEEENMLEGKGPSFRSAREAQVSFKKSKRGGTVSSRRSGGSVKYLPPKDQVSVGPDPEQHMYESDFDDDDEEDDKPIRRMSTKTRQAVAAVATAMPPRPGLQKRRSTAFFSDSGSEEPPSDDVVVQNTLPGSFKLSGEFTDDLADPTSIEFMELASATKGMLEKNLAKELGDSFYAVQITGFKKGSVVAEFVIIMTDDADKKTQKDVAKVIKQVAKNPVAGRTIQADSVDIEAPRSLSRRQSVAPGTEEDEGKKKSKWSAKLSKKFGGSKKKKDSAKKSAMEETERKPSMKSSMKRSSLKKKSLAQDEQSDAQSVALDLGDSASVQRYELAPYDSAMDTMQHDRDQGLFPVRGNFDSRPHDGLAEVYVDGDWEDHTQPPMESAPPADMQKSSMPRRVYAASDVSSMIATWSFDPEWGSIDLPPSEIGEEITPTRPTEIESSMVVTRAVTPDEEDEISDRDSVSSDNTEDSRFTVVPLELEPEDKERMRVKLPGEIIAPVVAKSKKKGGDPAANGDDKGCVVM